MYVYICLWNGCVPLQVGEDGIMPDVYNNILIFL